VDWWLGIIIGVFAAGGIIGLGLGLAAASRRRGRGSRGRPVPPTGVPLDRRSGDN
jgi:hypothetical protein